MKKTLKSIIALAMVICMLFAVSKKATAIEFAAHQNVILEGALQVINSSGTVHTTTSGSSNDITAGSKWFLDVKTDNPDAIQFTDTVGKYKVNVDPEKYTVKAYLKGTDEAIAVAQNGYLDLTSFEGGTFTITVGGDFYMRDFKKGYVTFIFDDTRMPFTEEAAKIFKEFGYPMSCAVPGRNVTEGSDLHKLLLDIQARGGEILSHGMNHRAITAEGVGGIYKYDDVYNEFSQSYEKLTNLGFEVNGIIEVGNGGNESTADYKMIETISRKFFKYSNAYGVSPQYTQPRRFMTWDSLESIKNQINKAKDNKTWHILSAHDQNEITSNPKNKIDGYQYLREILQYIKDTNGAVEVVTWDYMYNTYAEYSGDPIHKGGTATCSERAVCDICNFKYGTISPENHSDINFVKAKDEVHTQTELKGAVAAHHVCEGCEKVFKDNNGVAGEETTITELTSKAPEHNKSNIKNAPANCGVNGYIGNKYCSVCDKKMENGADIPATGNHTGGTATCIAQAKCTVCQLQYGSINANNHKYSAITDPDCDDCGAKRELGNQFVKEADGKYHYYNNGVHSKVTDLVKIDGKWYYLEKGVWANTVDTLHKINGKWFLIKKGIWTATTGLTEYKGKTFYVVGGKWNSNVNDLKKINGKWYFIKSGKWDSSLESLHKLNGKWFLVKGGMWKATTGLVKYQGKQFYVVGGKWESRTGVYKISGKNYFIKGGKWDKTITTLHKKSGKLLSIKNGMWTKSKAIIKYSGKKYFCDDGYAQTKKTGKVKVSGKTYTVKKGIVK